MTRIPVLSDRSVRRLGSAVRWVEAQNQLLPPAATGRPSGMTHIRLWNKTGRVLEPGEAVAFGGPLESPTTSLDTFRDFMGVETALPHASHGDFGAFAIISGPIPEDSFGSGQVSGVALAQINVVEDWHLWADIEPGQYRLHSHPAGTARIISRESGTGVKWGYMLLNNPGPAVWAAKSTAAIPANGTGPANIYDDANTQRESIVVSLKWLHGGQGISTDKELAITWRAGTWAVILAECE